MSNLSKRLLILESQFEEFHKTLSYYQTECICFPEGKEPFVGFPIYCAIAWLIKCPLHGERFTFPRSYLYVAKWMREKIYATVVEGNSSLFEPMKRPEQYRKAYLASFPVELFPGVEEEVVIEGPPQGVKHVLTLNDGTRIQLTDCRYPKLGDPEEDSDLVRRRNQKWQSETLSIMWNLFAKRGLVGKESSISASKTRAEEQ